MTKIPPTPFICMSITAGAAVYRALRLRALSVGSHFVYYLTQCNFPPSCLPGAKDQFPQTVSVHSRKKGLALSRNFCLKEVFHSPDSSFV